MTPTLTRISDGATGPAVCGFGSTAGPGPFFPHPPTPTPVPVPVQVPVPPAQPILRFPASEQPWATKAEVELALQTLKDKIALAASLLGEEPQTLGEARMRQNQIVTALAQLAK